MVDGPGHLADLNFILNVMTVFVSFLAVVFWVRFFRRISISGRQGMGWVWIFAAVMMILLLNLSAIVIVAGSGTISVGFAKVNVVEIGPMELMNTVGRTIIALSVTIGSFLLQLSMNEKGKKYAFSPVLAVAEPASHSAPKFALKSGCSYFLRKEPPGGGGSVAMELFADLVTHGSLGFVVTREYPPNLREKYQLLKTPMMWLTEDKDFSSCVHPNELAELSFMIKDFIRKSEDSVVLIDGVEYLITRNNFEVVLELIQGLNDVVVQKGSRLLTSFDSMTLTERQLHLLMTELKEFNPP